MVVVNEMPSTIAHACVRPFRGLDGGPSREATAAATATDKQLNIYGWYGRCGDFWKRIAIHTCGPCGGLTTNT